MRIVIAEIYPNVKAIANSFFSWSGPLLPPLRANFLFAAGRGPSPSALPSPAARTMCPLSGS